MDSIVVEGDLLDQPVEVIFNAWWNLNVIPWWLLPPKGGSGAIKKRGGTGSFKELGKLGPIPLGGAVLTSFVSTAVCFTAPCPRSWISP